MRTLEAMVLISLLTLAGCSDSSRPSDADLRKAVELQVGKEFPADAIRVEAIERLNGFSKQENVYVADVEIALVFLQSADQIIESAKQKADSTGIGALGVGMQAAALKMALGDFKAGHEITRERQITLVRAEKGWRIDPDAP